MDKNKKSDEFYIKLKAQLHDTTLWPSEYLYKFIVITETAKIENLKALFNHQGAVISTRPSKNGKYTSISVNVRMKNPDEVILKYKEVAAKIDGVISL
jgi:putative lipoic acid-binding regulatory protein